MKLIQHSVDEAAQRLMVGGFGPGGGSEIVRQLIESGHEVVGLARSEAAEQSRRPAGARPHCGNQLARAFSAAVGMSPMAYLRHIRIERMARLLITTDLSMAEAARSAAGPIPTTPAAPSTPNTGVSHRRAACRDDDGLVGSRAAQELAAYGSGTSRVFVRELPLADASSCPSEPVHW